MKFFKYLIGICVVMLGTTYTVQASINFPRVAFTFDFNTCGTLGPRFQLFSYDKYFGDRKWKTDLEDINTKSLISYSYGLGFGSYKVPSTDHDDNDIYHLYGMFLLSYQNKSFFEPFIGIYPGYAWGVEKGFFINPTTGVNIRAFYFSEDWNTRLLQTFIQLRVEYNTQLSSVFFGAGLILHFFYTPPFKDRFPKIPD